MSVERCERMSSRRRGWIAGQIDARWTAVTGPLGISAGSPGQAREHEVERLGRGDEDVRWLALVPRALPRRGIARADRDGRLAVRDAEALRLPHDADERRPQVALNVDREGLQRRDIKDARR